MYVCVLFSTNRIVFCLCILKSNINIYRYLYYKSRYYLYYDLMNERPIKRKVFIFFNEYFLFQSRIFSSKHKNSISLLVINLYVFKVLMSGIGGTGIPVPHKMLAHYSAHNINSN